MYLGFGFSFCDKASKSMGSIRQILQNNSMIEGWAIGNRFLLWDIAHLTTLWTICPSKAVLVIPNTKFLKTFGSFSTKINLIVKN